MKNISVSTLSKLALSIMVTGFLSACGGATKSKITDDGMTEEPSFPAPYSLTFDNQRGTFPTTDELQQIKAGMTKDELYKLIGRPHYDEGFFNVREWDYLFHFHTPGVPVDPDNKAAVPDITTCQFKIVFDRQKFARSFYWLPVFPQDALCPPSASGPQTQRYTVSADALFAFDRSGLNDMNPAGRQQLDELAKQVRHFDRLDAIRIEGHTDRLGSHQYNQGLSERRAETVRHYLASQGVPAGVMSSRGFGETRPIKECADNLTRHELIDCLQPNRRVEIEVDGSGQVLK